MRRPVLIFDFGNVVAFFDYGRAATTLGAPLGISGEELLLRLRNLGFSDLLRSYESGQMVAEAFSAAVSERIGRSIPHEEFAAAWSDIFTENPSIVPVLEGLKRAGYPLILGSNTNDMQAIRFREQFAATLAHFDRLVLSFEVGHIKPSSAFYLACAKAARADPQDCVFIDDLPDNVEGARAAGLKGIVYRETEEVLRDLAALGVAPMARGV